jgi:DNA-binding response OmpR family regulator
VAATPWAMSDHDAVGARILIVEDDARIRLSLQLVLEDEGHTVELAECAEAALDALPRRPADVVLIDLMLPGMDGFELCRRLRSESGVPILILTARSDSHDVVAGLEAGADDYMVKPAVPKELSARIRALLRRATRSESGPRRPVFGDIEVAPDAGTVRVAGVEVSLTKTEFKLLCELAQHPGRLLTREMLLDKVWGYGYFGDGRLVDVHIRRLRTKVEKDPTHPRHIVTVRGLGYKLEP